MLKGDQTRETILQLAVEHASVLGLHGLTIGSLAGHTGMSKSGLFRHFGSKESLQIETLKRGVDLFTQVVVAPALKQQRGLARVQALFDGWLEWSAGDRLPGGCLFIAAAVELDDQPGAARDYLVETQKNWLDLLARTAGKAVEAGAFRPDLDCPQFAHELNAIFLALHQARRLLRDPGATQRARTAFARLIEDAQHGSSAP